MTEYAVSSQSCLRYGSRAAPWARERWRPGYVEDDMARLAAPRAAFWHGGVR
jgi:hypothetical protein